MALIGLPCHRNTKITTYLKDVGSMIYISLEYQWNDIKCNSISNTLAKSAIIEG